MILFVDIYQIKNQINLHIQHIYFINQNVPCNFDNGKIQAIEEGWLHIINNKTEVK